MTMQDQSAWSGPVDETAGGGDPAGSDSMNEETNGHGGGIVGTAGRVIGGAAGTAAGAVEAAASAASSAASTVASVASSAADAVAGTADAVRVQIPQAVEAGSRIADTTGRAASVAAERLRTEPEDRLVAGSTFMFGVSLGLFIAGAPRVLVGLALAPAVAMGLAVVDRRPAPRVARATSA
jgi:hypothetical protein